MSANKINITTISRILEKNASARKVFKWAVGFILFILEQQRLIDGRSLEKVTIDFERKVIDLGDTFTQKVMARALGEYVIDRRLKRTKYIMKDMEDRKAFEENNTGKKNR
jgi:hypothetical protein